MSNRPAINGSVLEALRSVVAPLDTPEVREAYRTGNYPRADRTNDVNKRFRWDLFWASNGWLTLVDAGYEGAHDAHIDTALRAIVPPL